MQYNSDEESQIIHNHDVDTVDDLIWKYRVRKKDIMPYSVDEDSPNAYNYRVDIAGDLI